MVFLEEYVIVGYDSKKKTRQRICSHVSLCRLQQKEENVRVDNLPVCATQRLENVCVGE